MAEGTGVIKAALWAFLAFALLGWVLSIVGLAGLQRQCYFEPGLTIGQQLGGIRGLNFSYGCSRIYSYYWFMIAMQILSVVALLVLSCIRLLASSGISFLAWFTVLTVLFLQGSDPFLAVQDVAAGTGLFGDSYKYSRLTSAGWIITAIANLAIIFILGWRPRRVTSSSGFGK